MKLGRVWIRRVLSVLAISLAFSAHAQDELADFHSPLMCGDRLFQALAAEVQALEQAAGQGDVPADLYQMLMAHWQTEWDREIRRCVTDLYVLYGRLQRGVDPNDPAGGSALANEPELPRWNGALPDRSGRPDKDREKPPIAGRPDSRSESRAGEDREFRDLVARTQTRMRAKWAALLGRTGHGVERVD